MPKNHSSAALPAIIGNAASAAWASLKLAAPSQTTAPVTRMADYRALCAELLEALEIQLDELRFNNRLCVRARAALAQPEPEGPTYQEMQDLTSHCVKGSKSIEWVIQTAIARWGTPANNIREEN
jgi:hypothetical protein